MKKKKTVLILAAALAAVTVFSSFGCVYVRPKDDGPTKVTGSGTVSGEGNTSGGTEGETAFGIGETAEYRGVRVTLVSVTESRGKEYMEPAEGRVFLVCEFNIENGSDKEINVSSVLSFDAYIDDYSTSIDLLACTSSGKDTLDGTAAPGKKLGGAVGYEAPEDWQTVEIRFKADVWSDTEFIFKANKSDIG